MNKYFIFTNLLLQPSFKPGYYLGIKSDFPCSCSSSSSSYNCLDPTGSYNVEAGSACKQLARNVDAEFALLKHVKMLM